jgi:HNH endonuclease/Scavenger mRNA decapping enzyme C-term binding
VEERAVEVDHIVPCKLGGTDDLSNLQALCYLCNANKGARDATDFRAVREGRGHREVGCVFCEISEERILAGNELAIAIRDAYPATALHSLIIPRRHTGSYFDLYEPERRAISLLLDQVKARIEEMDRSTSGSIAARMRDKQSPTVMSISSRDAKAMWSNPRGAAKLHGRPETIIVPVLGLVYIAVRRRRFRWAKACPSRRRSMRSTSVPRCCLSGPSNRS